jgi:deoxycytidine triphosphate deaminase
MIISAKKVLELNKKHKLIENLCEREHNPEGVGFDVRVGEVYKIWGAGFLGIENRKTPDIEKVADIKQNDKKIMLKPEEYVLIKTIEKVNLPAKKIVVEKGKKPIYLMLNVYPRSTLQRSGILLLATKTDPGYFGELTFGLKNIANDTFEFELGARVANLVFEGVLGDLSKSYEGQWKGGRVGTEGFEKQN